MSNERSRREIRDYRTGIFFPDEHWGEYTTEGFEPWFEKKVENLELHSEHSDISNASVRHCCGTKPSDPDVEGVRNLLRLSMGVKSHYWTPPCSGFSTPKKSQSPSRSVEPIRQPWAPSTSSRNVKRHRPAEPDVLYETGESSSRGSDSDDVPVWFSWYSI